MHPSGFESSFVPESERQPTYDILANPETRERLKERMFRFVKAVHDRHIDSLVFLDKSARPVSWMFHDLWKGMYGAEMRPDMKCVNIGTSSQIQKGVSELLQTLYWGSPERGTAQSTDGLVKEFIKASETNETWLTTDQIPRIWQISMLDHLEIAEELKSIFKNGFKDKTVLMVDEMGATGKSQLAALGFFSLAFPEAKQIEAMSLFYSREFHEDASSKAGTDKQFVPWLKELGMAGVLELPDESLLSGTINQALIDRVLPALRKDVERNKAYLKEKTWEDDEMEDVLQRDLQNVDLYEHPEKMIQRARQLRKELKQLAQDALADQVRKTKPLT
ncbi:MAG: hypothetical protein NTX72_02780 [Candidatus Uhrbacteria bacterium]|nr:hypothetical protein [Candidatus Uhrbacteria bacterium]